MASAIYYDSIGSRSATLTDGTTTSGSFTSSDVLSDELRAIDGNITDVIGCLLYTSPSPRDVEEPRMPSSA